jgi:nucleotide-binding universal stress UspA family protein
MRNILLATDGSPSAESATENAIELAKATGWPLRVVTAWTVPVSAFGYAPFAVPPEIGDGEQKQAREALDAAVARIEAAGLEARGELREGNPVDEICAAAREHGAGLIVIGAHGWGTMKRLVFGSVSRGVLHAAPCPVMIVRRDDRTAPAS